MFKRLLAASERVNFCDAPVLTALKIAEQNDAQFFQNPVKMRCFLR